MSVVAIALGAITVVLGIPAICGYALYKGFSTGRMPARGASYSRSDSPIAFWLLAAMYAGLPIFVLSKLGPLAWRYFAGH